MLDHANQIRQIIIIRQMQIRIGKPLNELNQLLHRNNLQPTPKRSNSRNTLLNNNPHHLLKENQPLINNISNRSPARSASRKALICKDDSSSSILGKDSHQRVRSRRTTANSMAHQCQNHEQVGGTYYITIDRQQLYYCQKCANKLKSQGFPVKRDPQISVGSIRQQNDMYLTFPHLHGHPQYQALRQLLTEIYGTQDKLKQSIKISQLQQLFNTKFNQLQQFYDKVEQMVKQYREQGLIALNDLKEQFKSKLFEEETLNSVSKNQLKTMRDDIEGNIESIVGEVDEETFAHCVESYKQKLQSISNMSSTKLFNIETIKFNFQNIMQSTINAVQQGLKTIKHEYCSDGQRTVVNSQNEINYYCNQQQIPVKGPFRNLFNQQQDKPRKRLISRK